MEDLEASVGAHGGADLEERAGQLVGSSDEHEGDVAGRPSTRCLLMGWKRAYSMSSYGTLCLLALSV